MTGRRRGVLIALEGIDGSGKSTLQRNLARRWREAGYRVTCLHEPYDAALGAEALRVTRRNPSWAALLFTLDRWAGRPKVRALLARPQVVLLDRSFYSTLAYQGSALAPGKRRELERTQRSVAEPPDRVVLVAVPAAVGLGRVARRGRRRTPAERVDFLKRVERAYRRMARAPGWVVVDGQGTPVQVEAEVNRRLASMLRRRLPAVQRHH